MGTWFRWLWGWRGEVGYQQGHASALLVVRRPTALRQEHALGTALGQLVLESVAHGGQIAS